MARTLEFTVKANDQATGTFGRLIDLLDKKVSELQTQLAGLTVSIDANSINAISTAFEKVTAQVQAATVQVQEFTAQAKAAANVSTPQSSGTAPQTTFALVPSQQSPQQAASFSTQQQGSDVDDDAIIQAEELAQKINEVSEAKDKADKPTSFGLANLKSNLDNVLDRVASGIRSIGQLSASFLSVRFAAQEVFQSISGFFNGLISQAVQLNERILSVQATIASTTQVSIGSTVIEEPLERINALKAPVEAAIDDLRVRSLELSGITSDQSIGVFQIVSSNIGNVGGSLKDATDLTIGLAAGITTLGIPLNQANQEVASILRGQITQDSILAKQLGLTNEILAREKARGNLIPFINQSLAAVTAGQAIAAKGFSGITSNIQEIFETITLKAGGKLLQPLLDGLTVVYKFLQDNQEAIFQFFESFAAGFTSFAGSVTSIFTNLAPTIGGALNGVIKLAMSLIDGVGLGLNIFAEVLATLAAGLNILLSPLSFISNLIGESFSSTLGQILVVAGTLGGIIVGVIAPAVGFISTQISTF